MIAQSSLFCWLHILLYLLLTATLTTWSGKARPSHVRRVWNLAYIQICSTATMSAIPIRLQN